MDKEKRLFLIKEGNLKKSLLIMGIPTTFGLVITALYNIVDAYFVSGLGTSQLAAVSISFPLSQIMIAIGLIFGSGGASYISRLLGSGNKKEADETASTAIFSGLAIGIIFVLISILLLKPLIYALGSAESIYDFTREYTIIILLAAVFTIFNVTMNNIITAEGQAKITMIVMATGAIINIILDPIFIYNLDMKLKGAAIATVLSQLLSSIMYLYIILNKNTNLNISIKNVRLSKKILGEIFKIGIPAFVFQLLNSLAMGLTNNQAKIYGDEMLAAMGIMFRVMMIGNYIVIGFTKGLQPIIGLNYGAKNFKRVREAISISKIWTTTFCLIYAAIVIIFSKNIVSLFTKAEDIKVIDIAIRALIYNGIMFIFFAYQRVYATTFLALGKGKEGGILNLSRNGIFFFPLILLLPYLFGMDGILYALPMSDVFTVILTFILVRLNKKDLIVS